MRHRLLVLMSVWLLVTLGLGCLTQSDAYWQTRAQVAIATSSKVVTVDAANCNSATKQYKTSAGTQTLTGVTVTPGTDIGLVVTVNFDTNPLSNTPTVVSLVWDAAGANQALSLIKNISVTIGSDPQLWGRVGVTAGASKTITLTTTDSSNVYLDACAFTNVDQTGGTTSFPNATSGTGVSTVNVTSATNNKVIATANNGGGQSGITGTTIFDDTSSGSFVDAFANYDTGAASVTIGNSGALSRIVATDIKVAP